MDKYDEIIEKYRMIYDHHTHTTYSHGIGTIEDNVKVAVHKGLESIAITDHGPGHLGFGIKKSEVPNMKRDIALVKEKYLNIEVLLGVEANTLRVAPYIDAPKEDRNELGYDLVLAGYHFGIKKAGMIENWLYSHIGKGRHNKESVGLSRTRLLVKNTDMIVNAIYENEKAGNHIEILTHPGDKGPFDLEEISRVCEKTKTLMEINGKHPHLTVEEIKLVAKFDVSFVISSDAHAPKWVGVFEPQLKRALEAGLDIERIVNIAKK